MGLYRILSYEINYDVGSIGRNLTTDEWRISQAWQGFSAFEAYKKKRWVDLTVKCRDMEEKEIFAKVYSDLFLETGRSVLDVDDIDLPLGKDGHYIFEYNIN